MQKISLKLLYVFLPLLAGAAFVIDVFLYLTSQFNLGIDVGLFAISFKGLKEFLVLLLAAGCFILVKRRFLISDLTLAQKLGRFTLILAANFIITFALKLILPEYITASTPPTNASGVLLYVFYFNLIGWISFLTLMPLLFISRELIFYKQRRTTKLYFNLFFALLIISTLYVFVQGSPLEFGALSFQTGETGLDSTILIWSITIITFLLALRNDWITYLPRKQKFTYFAIGLVVLAQIAALKDAVYGEHISSYSVAASNFTDISWLFLLVYGSIAIFTLLLHLPTAKAVDRKLKESHSLNNFARQLNQELNSQKLTQLITQLTGQVLESQSTWLELYLPEEKKLKVVSHINLTQTQIINNPFDQLRGFNQQLVNHKGPILVNDVYQNKSLSDLAQWKKDARTLLAAPLYSSRDQLMGIIYATKFQPYGFDIDDISLLEGFANQAAIVLENSRLWAESLERERLEQELKVAREVQLKLMPQTMPQISGMDIDSFFLTAYEVGGDYYDFFQFADGQPGMIVGDVSGKGTSAAFYMAEFKGVIQTLAQTTKDPMELICRANQIFYASVEKQLFLTAVVGKYLPEQQEFQFVRAGHNPILYCPAGSQKSEYLQPPGLGIGLDSGAVFNQITQMAKLSVKPGDALLLYTDGLVEARNSTGEEFGDTRLQSLMDNCSRDDIRLIKEQILETVTDFIGATPLHDDLTFLLIKFYQAENSS